MATEAINACVIRLSGSYTVLDEGAGVQGQAHRRAAGAALSLQLHHHRGEHWIVASGIAEVVSGEDDLVRLDDRYGRVP